jgi:hypothetical protein
VISRVASTADGLGLGLLDEEGFEAIIERDLAEGRHVVPDNRPELFTTTYFHWPEEARDEVAAAGFRDVEAFAIEGLAHWIADVDAWLADPVRRERLLRAVRRIEQVRDCWRRLRTCWCSGAPEPARRPQKGGGRRVDSRRPPDTSLDYAAREGRVDCSAGGTSPASLSAVARCGFAGQSQLPT